VVFDWSGAIVLGMIFGGVVRYALRARSWTDVLARLPETRVAELAEGKQTKVTGVIEAPTTITAPLTGRPCVGWTVRSVGVDAAWVVDRVARFGACDFWLRDADGGRVLVHGTRAALVLANASGISAARDERGLVQREAIFAPGDRVTVVGMVRRELDPGGVAMYREAPTRLSLDGIPLWIVPVD
jgi:hypothetical protein